MAQQPRIAVAEGLKKLKVAPAKTFAEFVSKGDAPGVTPCWGGIAKRFERDFKSPAERTAIWSTLVGLGEKSPLLLFIKHNLSQPAVLAKIAADAPSLPVQVQRVLVSLDETRAPLKDRLQELSVEAQQLWAADDGTRRRERERFESRMAKLVAVDFIVAAQPGAAPG